MPVRLPDFGVSGLPGFPSRAFRTPPPKKRCRMKHHVLILLLIGAMAPRAWPDKPAVKRPPQAAAKPELSRAEGSVDTMGSTFTVVAYGEDRDQLQSAVASALEEARRLDQLLSNYRPESEWSLVNREAGERPVGVSTELFNLLAACVEYSRQSEGAFDITVGPLMKTWGFYKGSGHLPHRAEIRAALSSVGYRGLLLDARNQTVKFDVKGMDVDPGGIGKGYAVDRMAEEMKESGIGSALISGGGSRFYAIGNPPGGPQVCKVAIDAAKILSKA